MAETKVNALVDGLKANATLNLTAEQDEKLKALLNGGVTKIHTRREAGKKVVAELQTAVQGGDSAATEQLLQKLREGLRQAGQGREKFLDELDQLLQPEQRARVLLHLVQKAKDSGKPVEQLIDTLLSQGGEDKQ